MRRLGVVLLLLVSLAIIGYVAAATGNAPTRRYHDALGWSLAYPSAWQVEQSRSPSYIRIDVRETTMASFPLVSPISARHNSSSASMRIDAPRDRANQFPPEGVAFRVLLQQGGPATVKKRRETRFPLRLTTFRRQEDYAFETPRPVGRMVTVGGRTYLVQAWIGPQASRAARAKLARVVSSLSFRR
jgi:guanyl-specific ribonuclease Sa